MPAKATPRPYVLITPSCSRVDENAPAAKRRRVESDVEEMSRLPVTPVKRPIQETVGGETREKSATPTRTKATSNVYAHARSLLRLSSEIVGEHDGSLLGREAEREALDTFLSKQLPQLYGIEPCLPSKKAVLYVSGLPGTGKTALLQQTIVTLAGKAEEEDVEINMINCLSLKEPTDVWAHIIRGVKAPRGKDVPQRVEEQLRSDGQKHILLILDEADRLAMGKRSVLRQLFALAREADCRLTLVAIANSLDITQLTAEDDEMPELLHFPPYSDKSLIAIAKQRLSPLKTAYDGTVDASSTAALGETALFQPVALQLLARKVQAHSGDLRTFLGLLRTVIGLVEAEQIKALPPTPESTPTRADRVGRVDLLAHLTPSSAPKVTPRHALAACKNVKGGTAARLASIDPLIISLSNINLGARLVLIGLALMSRDTSSAILNISKAYAAYLASIKRAGGRAFADPLNENEFRLTIENLDVAGLLRASKSSSSPASKASKAKGAGAVLVLSHAYEKVLNVATTAGKPGECALAVTMVDKNRVKKRLEWEGDEEAPSAGFHGNGLASDGHILGTKRAHDDEERDHL